MTMIPFPLRREHRLIWCHVKRWLRHVIVLVLLLKHWWWWQVFIRVETTYICQVSNICYLNHCILLTVICICIIAWWHWEVGHHVCVKRVVVTIMIVATIVVLAVWFLLFTHSAFLYFLWYWRQSNTFWKIRQWINKLSLLSWFVEEWAGFSKFTLTRFYPVFARGCFVIAVDSS